MHDIADDTAAHRDWTTLERFAFRAAFVYFTLFLIASLLDVGPGPRVILSGISNTITGWFGRTLFQLDGSPTDAGVSWAIAQQSAAIAVAVLIGAAWSIVARRTEYRRLHGWFRIVLRYYVAIVMLVYGGFKVINTQFPAPALDQLAQPLGSLSPMGLLWNFMGYSPVYASFAGFGEALGAVLLFFRRTTMAGALVLVAVMSNVALMNYAYDVPVKQLSVNLLLASIVLLLPDARRLLAMFVFNQPTPPSDLRFELPRWLARVRRFLKPAIVVGATFVPLAFSYRIHSIQQRPSELAGIYDVERFVRNGQDIPPLATDSSRWRQIVFGRPGMMSIRLMSDSVRYMSATIDTTQHRVTLRPRNGPNRARLFDYQRQKSEMVMRGVEGRDTLVVTLRQLDQDRVFRLVRPVTPSDPE